MEIAELIAEARHLAATGEAKRIRTAAHFSVIDVAAQVGTSHTNVSRWENGLRRPSGERAVKYALLLRTLTKAVTKATIADIREAAQAKADREAAQANRATHHTHAATAAAQ